MGIFENLLSEISPPILLLFTLPLILLSHLLYKTLTHPLNSIPGPWICHLTPLWSWYHSYLGSESSQIRLLHERYGPIIRIAPNEIVISDGRALASIYTEKGGFLKAKCYKNFDSEGHATIFSELDVKERAKRAKAVMPLFSTGNLREGTKVFEKCCAGFVQRLERMKVEGKGDVLDVGRRLAVDVVCGYLFGEDYEGLAEGGKGEVKLSATGYVDSIVEVGRFFFLPPWLFKIVFEWYVWLWGSKEDERSAEQVNGFTGPLVKNALQGEGSDGTYQSRLLKAGISKHETDVQMKDVIFAGTDTSAMNLATIIWNLAKYPDCYKKLQQEILEAEEKDPEYNPQNLKFLDAVIREGLRISLANATRFARQVPPSGFTYTTLDGQRSYHLPGGTNVGMQPFTLHFNPSVFPDPREFKPERWEDPMKEMLRDYIPFGLGPRQCIARNLAMVELVYAVRALGRSGVLEGARGVGEKVEVLEWFNSKVVGGVVEVEW